MNGGEFIDLVSELGRRRGVPVRFDAKRGKGSHGTLYYGTRKTTVKDRRKELGPGLLNAMLKQIGLTRDDLDR
jgi:mRNA interferase HicA